MLSESSNLGLEEVDEEVLVTDEVYQGCSGQMK